MAQAHNESEMLLSSTDDLYIKEVRGKYVISSIPDAMVFGIPGTLLECQQCMDNASWRGVLLGACQECQQKYSGEGILIGFDEKVHDDAMPGYSNAAPFGFYCGYAPNVCDKIDKILEQVEDSRIPSEPRAIKHQDVYSFYGLASLNVDDFPLIYEEYSCEAFYDRYNIQSDDTEDKRHDAIVDTIDVLRYKFDPFSKEFFNKCEKMEKEWIMCPDATTQEEVFIALGKEQEQEKEEKDKNVLEKQCHYCGDIKPLKKCGKCKSIRYCSVACQSRDWSKGGAYACLDGEVSSPHKESCDYLLRLHMEQRRYEEAQQEEQVQQEEEQEEQEDDIDAELDREAGHWWVRRD